MAGPTVTILLPYKLDSLPKPAVIELVAEISEKIEGEHFWVEGRPFAYGCGSDYSEDLLEYVELSSLLGWQPKDMVGLSAMCNGDQDHRLLGRITLEIARHLNGVIAFDGPMARYTSDSKFIETNETLKYGHGSILSVQNFEAWLSHPDFRMVK